MTYVLALIVLFDKTLKKMRFCCNLNKRGDVMTQAEALKLIDELTDNEVKMLHDAILENQYTQAVSEDHPEED